MPKHTRFKPGDSLPADVVNDLSGSAEIYTNSGNVGSGENFIFIPPTNKQGMADITDSGIAPVYSHSVIYALAKPDGTGYQWFRTRQVGSQPYYTLANSSYSCVGTVKINPYTGREMEDDEGNKITEVSENEGRIMVAVQPIVEGERYVLRGMETKGENCPCYWNGYRLAFSRGDHPREFVVEHWESNNTLPFIDPTNTKYNELLWSEQRLNGLQLILTDDSDRYALPTDPYIQGWQSYQYHLKPGEYVSLQMSEELHVQYANGVPPENLFYSYFSQSTIDGLLGPYGQYWVPLPGSDYGRIVHIYPYSYVFNGNVYTQTFADSDISPDVSLPGFITDIEGGLNTPIAYDPSGNGGCYVAAVYHPVADKEESFEGLAKIVFPVNYPAVPTSVTPDPTGFEAQYPYYPLVFPEQGGAISTSATLTAAGWLAMSFGLADLTGSPVTEYQPAYYSSKDYVKFEVYALSNTSQKPQVPPPAYADCYDLDFTWSSSPIANLASGVYLFKCTGTFMPDPLGTPIMFSYDPMGTDGPVCYQRKFSVAQENSYVARSRDSYRFRYTVDEPVEETIKIAPPSIPGCYFKEVQEVDQNPSTPGDEPSEKTVYLIYQYSNGDKTVRIERPNYEGLISGEYGDVVFKSIDNKTGYMTFTFVPSQSDSPYALLLGDPIWVGFTTSVRMDITTKRANAQKKYIPIYCPTLDKNEVLAPGELVSFDIGKISLSTKIHKKYIPGSDWVDPLKDDEGHYIIPEGWSVSDAYVQTEAVEFEYLIATPPEMYHTDVDCTPKTKVRVVKYKHPTSDDINVKFKIKEDDLFVESVSSVDSVSTATPHTMYYGVPTTTDSVIDVREPFGAFNDCANVDSLAVFTKTDSNDIKYPCTCRLDYIPYGYALATKTPSCFYKATSNENCAPRLKGVAYDIVRVDGKLLVNGGCYVPCSSLTIND